MSIKTQESDEINILPLKKPPIPSSKPKPVDSLTDQLEKTSASIANHPALSTLSSNSTSNLSTKPVHTNGMKNQAKSLQPPQSPKSQNNHTNNSHKNSTSVHSSDNNNINNKTSNHIYCSFLSYL